MAMAQLFALSMNCNLEPCNLNLFTKIFSLNLTAIKINPTGFSGLPPVGPAIPVVAIPTFTPNLAQTPSTIATATASLTAP